jgi:hypothetical protein
MSRSTDWETPSNEPEKIAGDRRRDKRYEISLDVRWKLIRRRKVLDNGVGRTMDLSSGGMLIDAGRPLPVGLNLELSITWPVLLHNVAPLQLVVTGRIVRARGSQAAIKMVQHEFRTIGVPTEGRTSMSGTTRTPVPFLGGSSRETMGLAKA